MLGMYLGRRALRDNGQCSYISILYVGHIVKINSCTQACMLSQIHECDIQTEWVRYLVSSKVLNSVLFLVAARQ